MSLPRQEFKMVDLKKALSERGLSTKGSKAELMQRLSDDDPNVWSTLRETQHQDEAEETVNDNSRDESATREDVRYGRVEYERVAQRELELLRRERELLERERQLLQREREIMNSGADNASSIISTAGNVRGIKDLLPEFDATDNTFWRWKHQLELLKHTYQLDDSSTRMLIGSRLKGKALTWFYSKAEHITLNIDALLREMGQMFDHRPGKLTLRREFENRVWKSDESFRDYYHDKKILANRVPIEEGELLEYIIEGVTDVRLQSQVRLANFQTEAEMVQAFESVSLPSKKAADMKQKKDGTRYSVGSRVEATAKRERVTRCYNCHEVGHVATRCQRPASGRACFVCGSHEHLAKDCSRRASAGRGTVKESAAVSSTNLVHTVQLPRPYMFALEIATKDKDGNLYNYNVDAIVDSGSPISLIKESLVASETILPVNENVTQFYGINGSQLRITGIFYGDLSG